MSFLAPSARLALARSATRAAPRHLLRSSGAVAAQRLAASPLVASSSSSFHTTALRLSAGTSDSTLAARLGEELSFEQETSGGQTHGESAEPDFLRDFKSTGVWTIQDTPGSDEIALVRDFGNEKIKVLFSIGDIDAADPTPFEEDAEDAEQSGENDDEDAEFPVRCAISISKSGKGAMTIDAQAQGGVFGIENISFYKDGKLATELTAEADWKRRGLYIGPQFPTLDDSLQSQFEAFLEERGINDDLAMFVPMYAEYKEQKEYCNWLDNVKAFVEA